MSSPQSPSKFSAPIEMARVRSLFSRPDRVAPADFLRREIASRMHERLAVVKTTPRQVLDAGCGTGADLASLQAAFPQAQVLGVDASAAMLSQAPRAAKPGLLGRLLPAKAAPGLACADFAALPLAHNAVDLVWSNLGLMWHPQPDKVFAEWRRVLRTEGLLMFSSFGPDTFKELRAAGLETLPFVDMHDFGDQLVEAGFSTPVMDVERMTVTYASPEALLADVRAFGGNPLATRRRGLVGRSAWKQLLEGLGARRRSDGKIGLSFEIIYGHAFRPAPQKTAAGEAIISFHPRKP